MAPTILAFSLAVLTALISNFTGARSIGVCYGGNLPADQASDVVALYRSNNIGAMRLYYPNPNILNSLRGSNIQLLLGASNDDLPSLAGDPSAAAAWVQANVQPYLADIDLRYIAVGNEAVPGDLAQYVLPAMKNVAAVLSSVGQGQITVSTSVSTAVLGVSYPPSAGAFSSEAQSALGPIVQFLSRTSAPLMVNVYPYFAYAGDEGSSIPLPYALFTSPGTVVTDGGLGYQNLFDAMVDSVYSALEGSGGAGVPVVVSESGWPSAGGGDAATVENAQTYNSNLIRHVGQGTPKRPGAAVETFVFEMFNEDQKQPQGVENNFGLFYSNQQPVYPITFG